MSDIKLQNQVENESHVLYSLQSLGTPTHLIKDFGVNLVSRLSTFTNPQILHEILCRTITKSHFKTVTLNQKLITY